MRQGLLELVKLGGRGRPDARLATNVPKQAHQPIKGGLEPRAGLHGLAQRLEPGQLRGQALAKQDTACWVGTGGVVFTMTGIGDYLGVLFKDANSVGEVDGVAHGNGRRRVCGQSGELKAFALPHTGSVDLLVDGRKMRPAHPIRPEAHADAGLAMGGKRLPRSLVRTRPRRHSARSRERSLKYSPF